MRIAAMELAKVMRMRLELPITILTFRKETTAKNVQGMFQIQNEKFDSKLDSMQKKLWTAIHSNTLDRLVKELSQDIHLKDLHDHLGRTRCDVSF